MRKLVSVLTLVSILFITTNSTMAEAAQNKVVLHTRPAVINNIWEQNVEPTPETIRPEQVDESYAAWFEFLSGSDDTWYKEMANNSYSGSVSNNYLHNGMPAYRIELRSTDPNVYGSKRSEIAKDKPEPAACDSTYHFSVLLPEGGDEDYAIDPEGSEIIAQWHNTPDPGEDWTYPPLALRTYNGRYILERCWDEDPMSSEAKIDAEGKKAKYDLGSYLEDKGKWVDWRFRVKWGWLPSQHPTIEIYKNGSKIFELKDQPNTTNDKVGVHMKLGIYKWDWAQKDRMNNSVLSKRVIYYGSVAA